MKRTTKIISIAAFSITILLIAALIIFPRVIKKNARQQAAEKRSGLEAGEGGAAGFDGEGMRVYKAGDEPHITLESGELAAAVLSGDFDGDGAEEQVIVYRTLSGGPASPALYITFIEYNEASHEYMRIKTVKIEATRPGTLALYTQDLTGVHKNCILVTGMNDQDEKTMSVFMWDTENRLPRIDTLASIVTDGSISIEESERSLAYGQKAAGGAAWAILVRSRDTRSGNELDQIETSWAYNPSKRAYEPQKTVKLPGAKIEARTLRDVLSGSAPRFEQFVGGLWYHVSSAGTVDSEQYIYFDTENREIIFYGDATQQVYRWRNSSATRFGIYISSQNISVPTMNRIIDLELESVDSIRVHVFEDVRMRIQVNAPWDGSYRKAVAQGKYKEHLITSRVQAGYVCAWGKIQFLQNGEFEITNGTLRENGNYSFFSLENNEILELIPKLPPAAKNSQNAYPLPVRESYRVERSADSSIKLYRIRLGTRGLQTYNEPPLSLSPVNAE